MYTISAISNLAYMYIDDLMSINNQDFKKYLAQILNLRPKTHREHYFCFLPGYYCRLGGRVNFALLLITHKRDFSLQITHLHFLIVIFHLRRPLAFSSFSLYDTPGRAPHTNVLFWGLHDFPVNNLNREKLKSLKACFRCQFHSDSASVLFYFTFRKVYYPYGNIIKQYKLYLSGMI